MTGHGEVYKKLNLTNTDGSWKVHQKDCKCNCPRAQLCPVCNGVGYITETKDHGGTSATVSQRKCHGCFGYGWVTA